MTSVSDVEEAIESRDGANGTELVSDFSLLPVCAWVQILQMVTLQDRYHLALTCRRLNSLSTRQPAVWRWAEFDFFRLNKSRWQKDKTLCERFGRFFENVTLRFDLNLKLAPDQRKLLSELSSVWSLKSLVIQIPCVFSLTGDVNKASVLGCLDFSRACQQLKRLEVRVSFPYGISEELARGGFERMLHLLPGAVISCPHLNTVLVDCPIVLRDSSDLSLPSPVISSLLSSVPRLRELEINAFNVSDDLLRQLAGQIEHQLRSLTLVVFPVNSGSALPTLSVDAWRTLLSSCPRLNVSCTVYLRCPNVHLQSLFPLEADVPLVSVTVGPAEMCLEVLVADTETNIVEAAELARLHPKSLHTFIVRYQALDSKCEKAVVSLATGSPLLRNLVYAGEIHYENVTKIASLDRAWKNLEFYSGRVVTDDAERFNMSITKAWQAKKSGRYALHIGMTHFRREKLAEMKDQVSRCLGYTWEPVSELTQFGRKVYR